MSHGPSHDVFVKWNLNDLTTARAFFQHFLEPSVVNALDLSGLIPCKSDTSSQELSEIRSDLLFQAPVNGRPGGLSLLVEHKSQGALDRRVHSLPFQLRRNEVRIMEEMWRNDEAGYYPTVYLLGLYHGEGPYGGPMSVAESMRDFGELIPSHWRNRIHLIDLNGLSDEALMDKGRLGLFLLVLKHIYAGDFLSVLRQLKGAIQAVDNEGRGADFIEAVFRYVYRASKVRDKDQIMEFAKEALSASSGERVMTIAEQLLEEGRNEGEEKASLEIAANLLRDGHPPEAVARNTKLSLDTVLELAARS